MTALDLAAGLLIALGVVGVLVPLAPGVALVGLAVLGWAALTGGTTAWLTAVVALALLLTGSVAKYVLPGRRLAAAGIPLSTQLLGALGGLIGFLLLPVVGVLAGFPAGVYLAELRRVGPAQAGPSTRAALRAVGLSVLLDLLGAVLAALAWLVGVVVA